MRKRIKDACVYQCFIAHGVVNMVIKGPLVHYSNEPTSIILSVTYPLSFLSLYVDEIIDLFTSL